MSETLRKGRSSCLLFCMAPPSGQQYLMLSRVKGNWLIKHEALNSSTHCTLKWVSLAGDCSMWCGWGMSKAWTLHCMPFRVPRSQVRLLKICIFPWPFNCHPFSCLRVFFIRSLLSIRCFCFCSLFSFAWTTPTPSFLSLLHLYPEVSRDALQQHNTTSNFGLIFLSVHIYTLRNREKETSEEPAEEAF